MVDTVSSDSKKTVQALYDAAAAGDVERFLGTMHPQFQAKLPGYLPWGGVHNGPDEFKTNVLLGMASTIDLGSLKLQSMFGEGDKVFATATAKALRSGEEFMIGEDWTVKDGKVYRLRLFYFDPTPVFGRIFT